MFKRFKSFFFLAGNIGSNKKLFQPFQVRSNNPVTRLLPPNFRACFHIKDLNLLIIQKLGKIFTHTIRLLSDLLDGSK